MIRLGSLFSGIGGLELGIERAASSAGLEAVTVWQVERDQFARRILKKHWPNATRFDDVFEFPPTDAAGLEVDLICGGFPCQPVSIAGKQKGANDERWLWDEMRRICEVLRPRFILAENVPGLLSAGTFRGQLFGNILRDLAALGYYVEWDCIPASAVGAAHRRDRVFILADTDDPGRQEQRRTESAQAQHSATERRRQWSPEPDVCRVVNGVSDRVDRVKRLRCLGNAVVPQVAELVGGWIFDRLKT